MLVLVLFQIILLGLRALTFCLLTVFNSLQVVLVDFDLLDLAENVRLVFLVLLLLRHL